MPTRANAVEGGEVSGAPASAITLVKGKPAAHKGGEDKGTDLRAKAGTGAGGAPPLSLTAKLQELKELRTKDLISEEEYHRERKRLLDQY